MNKELIQKVQQGTQLQWVKASERTPSESGTYFTKSIYNDHKDIYNTATEFSLGCWVVDDEDIDVLEWLEELPSTEEAPLQEVRNKEEITHIQDTLDNIYEEYIPDFEYISPYSVKKAMMKFALFLSQKFTPQPASNETPVKEEK